MAAASPLMGYSLIWLGYAWRRHGAAGLVRMAAYNVVRCISRVGGTGASREPDPFDQQYGSDTAGIREIRTLDVLASPAAPYAVRYGPSSAQCVREVLDLLELDHRRFCFIDYGSGKGRVLLVAAGFPFRKVVGFEFSRELHEIALKNIAGVSSDFIRCGNVTSLHCEAASFEPPRSDLVCYFYNPFGPPVMATVAARLMAHHQRFGSEIIIIYVDPRHREIFEQTGKFSLLNETRNAVVLRAS